MSALLKTPTAIGLLTGLALPPIIARFVVFPAYVQSKYDDVDDLKHNVNYLGWHVKLLEEAQGLSESEVLVPISNQRIHESLLSRW
ncbi:uncharacterized protein CANTADRAFT_272611 [Suhomyces tanzawaensis NRRL Y-17324]|uniref:Uncharacterized protein n=1 Tax=Suhomyces tanzawaensis NRRL Y-17324 TaxID=984487 RepID=A0A1E4SGT8_9ASCO|nr:uncharacterized protein CANTADRAFT_272611 [Suhomyces tanzawaensis NRRL Y-17324]ODV78718.1 hypothetical protein CANTADRAFT_272611 [Suhomyces tanzawaensis NRRL Y-17324]